MTPELHRFLEMIGAGREIDMDRLKTAMRDARYTGTTSIHWRNGLPLQLDIFATAIRVSIVEGLDNQKGPGSGS